MYMYVSIHVHMYLHVHVCQYILQYVHLDTTHISEFLIHFEAWVKLAQRWLVCAPLGKILSQSTLMLLVIT